MDSIESQIRNLQFRLSILEREEFLIGATCQLRVFFSVPNLQIRNLQNPNLQKPKLGFQIRK